MTRLTPQFSADRMVKEYVDRIYLPASRAFRRRIAAGAAVARDLESWLARVDDAWPSIRFGTFSSSPADGQWTFEVQAYLGGLTPEDVAVQMFADGTGDEGPTAVSLKRDGPIRGSVNGHVYRGSVAATRPAAHFTPRVVSFHPDAFVPMEARHILWWRP
jgi:starch phosphorylase